LKWSLLAGSGYFFLVSVVHLAGVKVPLLFVYFNVSSHAYQDRIISFLAFGWSMFLLAGVDTLKHGSMRIIKYILIAGAGAVTGLSLINAVTDFQKFSPELTTSVFWLETGVLFLYLLWLALFFFLSKKPQQKA